MMSFSISTKRHTAWFLIATIIAPLFAPYSAYALTGGPSQPEVQSFEPIGTSEMVDVSSGSFTYNIPLMEVGGYPINLAYHSGISMDDEASCMGGLGWNINVGVINRNMRGLPDDFNGDPVRKEFNMAANKTYGGKLGVAIEVFGVKGKGGGQAKGSLSASMGGFYNNYRGVGLEFGIAPSFSASAKGGAGMTLGLGLTASSSQGTSLSPQVGLNFKNKIKGADTGDQGYLTSGLSLGSTVNSRTGVQSLTMGVSMGISAQNVQKNKDKAGKDVTETRSIGEPRSLYGGDASFDFAAPTYSPGAQFSYENQSVSMAFTIGGELWGVNPSATVTGYFSKQELAQKDITSPGFGYLYAQGAKSRYGALMDFNREKDMAYTENTPNLPLPIVTNDVYSATGQGIAGSYQLKRGDVGIFSDPPMQSYGAGVNLGAEIGLGNTFHAGADIVANFNNSVTQAWVEKNDAAKQLAFQGDVPGTDFEPAYFKIAGEKSVESDPGYFSNLGGIRPARIRLDPGADGQMNVVAQDHLEGIGSLPKPAKRSKREKRNQPITYLSAKEAEKFGLETSILSYQENVYGNYLKPTVNAVIQRVDNNIRKAHHISEVTTLRQDGLRYVYGIPAYNTIQEEVGFSVGKSGANCPLGLVSYTPGSENSVNNNKGIENYFSKTTLPPYAHAYLLTAVLSPDYVDLKNDGPTLDDLGTYTKFRYTRIQSAYRWRVPFQKNQANYNEGFKSDANDDKANYIYGEKEYWLLHSVESKTQLAEFYYTSREDGIGVADQNGGIDNNQTLRKLDKIVLFSLPDRENNKANAEPIKTVNFVYDYSLGRGVPNNKSGGGKLTLKQLFFTYGRSNKGKLSPYQFTYDNPNDPNNPAQPKYTYNQKAYNRWGTFQPNWATSCDPTISGSKLSTSDFPYVPQDNRSAQNEYARWQNLTEIKLPSGGTIKVEYEANDYAFVQNLRAMEMVQIMGFAGAVSDYPNLSNELYLDESHPKNYVFFDLPAGRTIPGTLSQTDADAELKRRYLTDPNGGNAGMEYLYFKCLVNLGEAGTGKYEYVPGYTNFVSWGALKSGSGTGQNYNVGYIELQPACSKDKDKFNPKNKCGDQVNPIAKAAWQFARLNLPRIAYGEPDPKEEVSEQFVRAMGALVMQFGQFFGGFNQQMLTKKMGQEVIPSKSWLRLFSPLGKKIGGGARVKSVRISDGWQNMSGSPLADAEYGQEYFYTKVERGDTISSGVAAYEPLVGGDENPFRQPIPYKEEMLLAPDNNHFQEKPYGEGFFPNPQIVYSQVRVQNLQYKEVKRNATGYVVHEYYTARDFPTKVSDTGIRPHRKRTNPVFRLLKIKNKDYMTASQGFVVELNDMHGKPKRQEVFDEGGTLISGVEYRYKTDAQGLNNTVSIIRPSGKLEQQNIGLEMEMVADSRESVSSMKAPGVHINSDGFLVSVFPGLAVVPLPAFQSEETRFRSMVLTKVVRRYGLLQTTVAYDLGSQVSTENLAWDSETGEVLLTKTYNEHDDPVFSLNFPAHWAYRGMQAAYQNVGAKFSGNVTTKGFFGPTNTALFMPGDEVALTIPGNTVFALKGWVKDIISNTVYIVDKNGQPIPTGTYDCKIMRSGHRNQQLSSVGSLTSLQYPFDANNKLNFNNKQILQASAIEYDDQWQTWCGEKTVTNSCECKPQPQSLTAEFLTLLNSQVNAGGQFVLKPKANPFTLNTGQYPLLNAFMNGKCTPPPGWQGGNTPNWFATELSGNDLKCFFGKAYSDAKVCWEECLTIKNFKVLLDAPLPTAINFHSIGPNPSTCDNASICFKANVTGYRDQQGAVTKALRQMVFNFCAEKSCFDFYNCARRQTIARCGDQAPGDTVNPYRLNIRGVYRPKRTWAYLTDRVPDPTAAITAQGNTRTDGYFSKFSSFWTPTNSNIWTRQTTDWTWAKQVTRFNPVGNEIENQDALGNYSAELVGYANTQVTAVANNARYRQIAFEGFEDYDFAMPGCQRHFGFPVANDTTSKTSHTGKFSMAVPPNRPISSKYPLAWPVCPPPPSIVEKDAKPYAMHICDCVGRFSPDTGKYVFSAWVRENQPLGTLKYNTASVEIKTAGQTFSFKPAGQVIEGWQRIFGEFSIPSTGATDIEVVLLGNGVQAWFDDLRILPFNSSLKSYVYHPRTLRFTFELDENNYFTEYQYDQSGNLERVKKETERGVMTIQESRFGQQKHQ